MCLIRKKSYKVTYIRYGLEHKTELRIYYLKARSVSKAAKKLSNLDPFLIKIVDIENMEVE